MLNKYKQRRKPIKRQRNHKCTDSKEVFKYFWVADFTYVVVCFFEQAATVGGPFYVVFEAIKSKIDRYHNCHYRGKRGKWFEDFHCTQFK